MEPGLDLKCDFCDPDNKESAIPHEMKSLRLRVANMCCAGEENTIRQVLDSFTGIDEVSVNVIGRYAVLKHCPQTCCAPVDRIVSSLNDKMLGVSIQENFDDSAEENEGESMSMASIVHVGVTCALFLFAASYEFSHFAMHKKSAFDMAELAYILCGFFGVLPVIARAMEVLARSSIDINILVLVATFASFVAHDFRDGALVITLFVAAKALEDAVMHRVRNAIKISASSVGRFALRIEGSEQNSVLLEDLHVGDRIALRAGDMIPVDGDVVTGQAVVDESAITGEAAPVHKAVGSRVMSGGILQNGYLEVSVQVEVKDSVMRKLNDTVNEVQARKGAFATTVDRFAAYWVPVVVVGAVGFICISGYVTGNWKSSMNRGLVLMLLACPCSIVLSSPIASLSTIAVAAKHGVIIKGSEVLESLGTIDTVAVDKTGTMTQGTFSVLASMRFTTEKEEDADEVGTKLYDPIKLAAALENKSAHPLANAIIREFTDCITEMSEPFPDSKKVKTMDGIGVQGWVDVKGEDPVHVAVGNERLFKDHQKLSLGSTSEATPAPAAGKKATNMGGKCMLKKGQADQLKEFALKWESSSIVYVTVEDELAMCMALGGIDFLSDYTVALLLTMLLFCADVVRPEAAATVQRLSDLGCNVIMLTGDAAPVATKVLYSVTFSFAMLNWYIRL